MARSAVTRMSIKGHRNYRTIIQSQGKDRYMLVISRMHHCTKDLHLDVFYFCHDFAIQVITYVLMDHLTLIPVQNSETTTILALTPEPVQNCDIYSQGTPNW